MEKELIIEYNGKEEKVILKDLTWGENNDAVKDALKLGLSDLVSIHECRLVRSIKKAPFPISREGIRGLSRRTGDRLFNEMQALNGLSGDEAKNSEALPKQEGLPAEQ